jgi:type II secretory pathway component PulF
MNFIRNLALLFKSHFQPNLSVELWIDLLDAGYSDQEIVAILGNSTTSHSPMVLLNRSLRHQVSILETQISSKLSLWWVLIEKRERKKIKNMFSHALGYPLFLLSMAWMTMIFLNHMLVAGLSSLETVTTPSSSDSWFGFLVGLELFYLVIALCILAWYLLPRRYRNQFTLKFYTHPFLEIKRNAVSHCFLELMINGINRGISFDDLIFALMNSKDPVQNSLVQRLKGDLNQGLGIADAIQRIDQRLRFAFILNNVDHSVETNLQRYLNLLSMKIKHNISLLRWFLLGFAYLSFGVIIVTAYQMMLEPLRVMEDIL